MENEEIKKKCRACLKEKDLLDFYNLSSNKDGKNPKCKKCVKEGVKIFLEDVEIDYKVCKTCLIRKPIENFIKDKTSKLGRLGHCKSCTSTKKEKEILKEGFKRCPKCKVVSKHENFNKYSKTYDGLSCYCKECVRIDSYKRRGKEIKPKKFYPEKEDGKKYCPKCDKNVLFSDFNKDISTKSGLESCCKNCKNLYKESVIKICGVYKITNPISCIYIGSSSNIKNRWSAYKKCQQSRIKESFTKYGIENHIFEIIEECESDELKCRERHWQDFYDVLGENGLNDILEKCGDKNQVFSDRMKDKIRQTNTGKKATESTKKKQSENNTRKRMVIHLPTGIFFESIKIASETFNMDDSYLYYNLVYSKNNKTDLILC